MALGQRKQKKEKEKKLKMVEKKIEKKNKEQLEEKQQEEAQNELNLEELKELLQRTQANFENYRKQVQKRVQEMEKTASSKIIAQLLPILDNFDLALNCCQQNENFVQGIQLIHCQLYNLLSEQGVEVIKTKEELFNPYLHEALMKEESELPENIIIAELQKGFMIKGRVIRHAKVKLSKGKKLEKREAVENVENRAKESLGENLSLKEHFP